ncbi:MAG TPA: hypothetical protein VF815_02280 [Myxococcaceae bacterium]
MEARDQLYRNVLVFTSAEVPLAHPSQDPEALTALRAELWLARDGAELKRAINEGVQTLAQLIARDLRDTQVPSLTRAEADHVEPVANGTRQIVRKASGVTAGQYVSQPVPLRVQPWNSVARGE